MNVDDVSTVVQILFQIFILTKTSTTKVYYTQIIGPGSACVCLRLCVCVSYQILKHQCEGLLCVDDVVKCDNVGVFQVLQQRH